MGGKKYRETHREELRIKARQYYREHVEQCKAYQKDYNKKNQSKINKRALEYYYKHREELRPKKNAQKRVRRVPLKEKCELCGATEKLERHHPDYNKPLEVITVCATCNKKLPYIPKVKAKLKKVCENPDCRREFASIRSDARFCSRKCEWKVWSKKRSERQIRTIQ